MFSVLPSIISLSLCFIYASGDADTEVIEGHISHGINSFNGALIADYTAHLSPAQGFPGILLLLGIPEIATTDGAISGLSDDTSLVITTENFANLNPLLTYDPAFVGIPIHDVGILGILSQNSLDRFEVVSSTNSALGLFNVKLDENEFDVTLEAWNQMSGIMTVKCGAGDSDSSDSDSDSSDSESSSSDSSSDESSTTNSVSISICGGIPHGIYTVWQRFILNYGTAEVFVNNGPVFLPNIIVADENGSGELEWNTNWCPTEECVVGSNCILEYAIAYHFDWSVYGAAPNMLNHSPNAGPGLLDSIQLSFTINGDRLQNNENDYYQCAS